MSAQMDEIRQAPAPAAPVPPEPVRLETEVPPPAPAVPDPVLADSRLSALLFGLGAVLLAFAAKAGIATWPGAELFASLTAGGPIDVFVAIRGYALTLVIAYWGGRPSVTSRRFVFATWAVLAPGLAYLWRDQLPIGWVDPRHYPSITYLATAMAIPCAVAMLLEPLFARWRPAADEAFARRRRWLIVLAMLFATVPQSALDVTTSLHPYTMDLYALAWDRAAGLNFAQALVREIDGVLGLSQFVVMCYRLVPLGLLAVAVVQLSGRPRHVASSVLIWVALSIAAMTAYHFMPITGPRYVFGAERFAAALADGVPHAIESIPVTPYPRNGMPSMHFGWALAAAILWWQSGTQWWSRAVMVLLAAVTAVATLYQGEHYAVDLIVAVPFVLAVIALASTGVPWSGSRRGQVLAAGLGTWLAWVLLLRWQTPTLADHPALCWLMVGLTALVVAVQARWMRGFAATAARAPEPAAEPVADLAARTLQRRVGALFFTSGFAALIYQVLFAKQLALTFGSTATATFTVLATFLGGMAIGSLIGGNLALRVARPVAAYAFAEVGIALYCVLTPRLFDGAQSLYVAAAGGMPAEAGVLTALRVALGAGVLLLPTVLMGATLPLLAHALVPRGARMGPQVAWLYFANTAGAALGALTSAYFVIPALGAHRTTLIAAVLNLLVGLGALELAKRPEWIARATGAQPPAPARAAPPALQAAAIASLALGGVLSLGLEVLYVHLLSIVAGNSTYAFGLMVSTFLLGLSAGGEAARRVLLHPRADAGKALGWALLGLSVAVSIGAGAWNAIPGYFASFDEYPLVTTFGAREAVRGLVCAIVMLPATVFIGAAYAFAMDIVTSGGAGARRLGAAAAANTAGNIVGVLFFGFVALPALGGLGAGRLIGFSAALLGLGVLLAARPPRWWRLALPVVPTAAALAAGSAWSLDYNALTTGANVYFQAQDWGRVLAHAESIDGGLTTVNEIQVSPTERVKTLLTNGKFQGSDAVRGEMQAQVGFGLAPLLHTTARGQALVIGFGTGVTTRVMAAAGFQSVDVAELSGDILKLAGEHFASVNDRVLEHPRVKAHVTDGRNLLLLSPPRRYDVIGIEISSIWFAGAASLYNREFYRLAADRLRADGVLQQWMQLHRLAPTDLLQVMSSIRSEFRFVSLYVIGGQGILVATNDERHAAQQPQALAMLESEPGLASVRQVLGRPLAALAADRLLDPAGVDRFVTQLGVDPRLWISTDDNLRLEYSTPRANVNDPQSSIQRNLALLGKAR